MNQVNFSFQYGEYVAAHPTNSGGSSSGGSGGGMVLPYYTPTGPDSWTNGYSIDTSIPYNSDGTVNVTDMLQKLYNMMTYGAFADQMDYNNMVNIAAYLMNIGNIWGSLSSAQQAQVTKYLNAPISINGGTPGPMISQIAPIIAEAMIHGTYYLNGGGQAGQTAANAFATQFVNALKTISGSCPLFDDLYNYAYACQQDLPNWYNLPSTTNQTEDGFFFSEAINWENTFTYNSSVSQLINEWKHQQVDDGLANCKNVFEAFAWLANFMDNENINDVNDELGGGGSLQNYLSGPMGNSINAMSSAWSSGNFNATTAQQFFGYMNDIEVYGQDERLGSMQPQIQQVYNDFCGSNSQISVTFTPPGIGNKAVTMPLGQLYQDIVNKTPITTANGSYTPQWSDMSNALNSLQPSTVNQGSSTTPSFPTPPGFATGSNDIQQLNSSDTSKSTAEGQIIQNLEGVLEKLEAFVEALYSSMVDPEKTIVSQNMQQANS
jgi:hypothetical protein